MQRVRRWGRSATALGVACVLGMLVFTLKATAEDDRSAQAADGGSQKTADGWVRTGTLDAAEAVQAAAADQRRVYAINNTHVAAYDRETGERVALSQGPAQHLNSGFLWKDRLYCAHSNYPRVPERSMIKVLDLATMQLRTFKDFGASEGSLTWAFQHDGGWWCNFAYYGDQNHRTTLLCFDDQWQERGHWTYPDHVIDQLGRYSLSGGIWYGGHLLVTGHDEPVIYRLRLPQEGNELECVDQVPAPFTGQGFAVDPRTGGLVGIHRARRQLVFAKTADTTPHDSCQSR